MCIRDRILTARIMRNIIINIVMKPMSIPILMNIMYRKPMETVIYIPVSYTHLDVYKRQS